MKCNITFVLIVIILCVVSCRKNEPENKLVTKFNYSPDFEYSGDLSVGNKVKFDTSGIPPNSIFKWDFGDGNTSNNAAPEHIFADRGLYIVTLSITWDTNVTIQKEVNITLLPKDFNKIRSWKGIHANGPQSDPSQTVVKDINEKSSINVISDTTCGFIIHNIFVLQLFNNLTFLSLKAGLQKRSYITQLLTIVCGTTFILNMVQASLQVLSVLTCIRNSPLIIFDKLFPFPYLCNPKFCSLLIVR